MATAGVAVFCDEGNDWGGRQRPAAAPSLLGGQAPAPRFIVVAVLCLRALRARTQRDPIKFSPQLRRPILLLCRRRTCGHLGTIFCDVQEGRCRTHSYQILIAALLSDLCLSKTAVSNMQLYESKDQRILMLLLLIANWLNLTIVLQIRLKPIRHLSFKPPMFLLLNIFLLGSLGALPATGRVSSGRLKLGSLWIFWLAEIFKIL